MNKPALKSDEQLSREYWSGLTRLQVFIEHGKLFLMFVGFSVIYGAATALKWAKLKRLLNLC